MAQHRIPGLSVVVVRDGQEVYARGFGHRDPASRAPMTPDTVFGVGSISKTFTALAATRLAARGLLDLETPVRERIDLRVDRAERPIRPWHLLSHSSGIPELFGKTAALWALAEGREPPIALATWPEFLAFVNAAAEHVLSAPGERYAYSNDAFTLVAAVLEQVTGTPFPLHVQEELLTPLGMRDSTYLDPALTGVVDRVTGHLQVDGQLRPAPNPVHPLGHASGGLFSTARDLGRYMRALLDGSEVIAREVVAAMWTPRVAVESTGFNTRAGSWYGLGWRIGELFGERIVEHGGDFLVSGGHLLLLPGRRTGIAIGMNRQPGGAARQMAEAVAEALVAETLTATYAGLAGSYESHAGLLRAGVAVEAGRLYLHGDFPAGMGGQFRLPLELVDPREGTFRIAYPGFGDLTVRFRPGAPATGSQYLFFDRFLLVRRSGSGR
jgi:CubicO group peptidase (beta-lactamase class C family)